MAARRAPWPNTKRDPLVPARRRARPRLDPGGRRAPLPRRETALGEVRQGRLERGPLRRRRHHLKYARPRMFEPGTHFADHVIRAVCGRGGMGVVYRATHIPLEREVALKVIAPEFSQDAE